MQNSSDIAILILAAGSSSRMGTPKQLLPWKHTTLLGNTIETALELKTTNVYVILGANFSAITEKINAYPVQIINNKNWKNGLGSSIACGINHFKTLNISYKAVLVLLADQPLIDVFHLKEMINTYQLGHTIVTTSYANNKEGVPAIFDAAYFDELSALNTDFGAKELIKHNKTFSINASNKTKDVDTKEDYESFL